MNADLRAVVVEAVRQLDAEIAALIRVDGQAWRRCEVAVEGLSDLRRCLAHALWDGDRDHRCTYSPVDDSPSGGEVLECIDCGSTVVAALLAVEAKPGVHGLECLAHDDPDECVCSRRDHVMTPDDYGDPLFDRDRPNSAWGSDWRPDA